jgi:hypothetical protein
MFYATIMFCKSSREVNRPINRNGENTGASADRIGIKLGARARTPLGSYFMFHI